MSGGGKKMSWQLLQAPRFAEELARLSSKYRSQISRKILDLTRNPTPGGGKTALKGYSGLFRVRAGDFRIIYVYNDKVVQVLSLARKSEGTYDDLDQLEFKEFEGYRSVAGRQPVQYEIAEWEELAKVWAAPKEKSPEPLPQPINATMLELLEIPVECREALLKVKTVEDLLDIGDMPSELCYKVLDHICPRKQQEAPQAPTPVVVLADLVDPIAASVTGPLDALDHSDSELERKDMRPSKSMRGTREKSGLPALMKTPAPLVVVSTRRQEPMTPYKGNTSKGIGKDARYSVKLNGTVQLVYNVGNNERALLTTDAHPDLIELVNEAKRRGGGSQGGGGFLINEYRYVLVPTRSGQVLYAGVYTSDLEFVFEKTLISPVAPTSIRPGDIWPGPHVGVRYTLAAGAKDIRYEEETARGTIRDVSLSEQHTSSAIASLLQMCRAIKPAGGAVYINEAREIFAPVDDGTSYRRRYIGHLGGRPWFKEPI